MSIASDDYRGRLSDFRKELDDRSQAILSRRREIPIRQDNFRELNLLDTEECIMELVRSRITNMMEDVLDIEKSIAAADRELRSVECIKKGYR